MKRQAHYAISLLASFVLLLHCLPRAIALSPSTKWQAQLLLAPNKDVESSGSLAKVSALKGAAVYICSNNEEMAILCLESSESAGVKVVLPDKTTIALGPGKELLLSKNLDAEFEEVNPGKHIGYRHITELKSVEMYKAFLVDFSIKSVVASCKPLREIIAHPDPQLKKLAEGILKNCAVLGELDSTDAYQFPDQLPDDGVTGSFRNNNGTDRKDSPATSISARLDSNYVSVDSGRQMVPLQGQVTVQELNGAPKQALFAAAEFNSNELHALAKNGVIYGPASNDNFLDLLKGFVFFMPQRNVSVQTREGVVYIPRGAAVWIMETGANVAIYDFDDKRRNEPVKVVANKKPFSLSPGTELLLSRSTISDFDSLNPASGAIGYRHLLVGNVGEGITSFVCDFSIPHGLSNVEVIHNLLFSKDPVQKRVAHQMLKNAIILADLTGYDYKLPNR